MQVGHKGTAVERPVLLFSLPYITLFTIGSGDAYIEPSLEREDASCCLGRIMILDVVWRRDARLVLNTGEEAASHTSHLVAAVLICKIFRVSSSNLTSLFVNVLLQ